MTRSHAHLTVRSMDDALVAQRYRLHQQLDSGAMGAVWLAQHATLGSWVAIKIIKSEAAQNAEALQRFYREAKLAAQIQSAHVVRVLDVGRCPDPADGAFIVMELLKGESLRARIRRLGRVSLQHTAQITTHACRAMARAHELGLVHRDLKPANVFLSRCHEDEDEVAKVLDFGCAKVPDALSSTDAQTRTGALLGTPYYMSPEQAQGLRNIDWRSDLWSIGVVVFECLTGKRPFSASSLGPLIAKVIGAPVPVPSQTAPEAAISPAVDAWMARALQRKPDDRFSSASELAQALREAAGAA